jgi:hypothetical protein
MTIYRPAQGPLLMYSSAFFSASSTGRRSWAEIERWRDKKEGVLTRAMDVAGLLAEWAYGKIPGAVRSQVGLRQADRKASAHPRFERSAPR